MIANKQQGLSLYLVMYLVLLRALQASKRTNGRHLHPKAINFYSVSVQCKSAS